MKITKPEIRSGDANFDFWLKQMPPVKKALEHLKKDIAEGTLRSFADYYEDCAEANDYQMSTVGMYQKLAACIWRETGLFTEPAARRPDYFWQHGMKLSEEKTGDIYMVIIGAKRSAWDACLYHVNEKTIVYKMAAPWGFKIDKRKIAKIVN